MFLSNSMFRAAVQFFFGMICHVESDGKNGPVRVRVLYVKSCNEIARRRSLSHLMF